MRTIATLCLLFLSMAAVEISARVWHGDRGNAAERPILSLGDLSRMATRGFEEAPILPRQVDGLSYDRGRRYTWSDPVAPEEDPTGRSLDLIYLEYEPGNTRCFPDLFFHSPEVCMAAAGELIEADRWAENLRGTEIGLRRATFREYRSHQPLYIYKVAWFSRDYPVRLGVNDHLKKLQSSLVPRSSPPARLLTAALKGFENEAEAADFFRQNILSRLRWTPETER